MLAPILGSVVALAVGATLTGSGQQKRKKAPLPQRGSGKSLSRCTPCAAQARVLAARTVAEHIRNKVAL